MCRDNLVCILMGRGAPFEPELFTPCGAIPEVHVDKRLIGNSGFGGELLEVCERAFLESDGDLLLEAFGVGIALGAREIVVLSHRYHLWV